MTPSGKGRFEGASGRRRPSCTNTTSLYRMPVMPEEQRVVVSQVSTNGQFIYLKPNIWSLC
jgi:hypothetical protein